MQRIWNSVDNRMGEMVYDNLMWSKTQKDVAFMLMRSAGWNIGTIRELGGAAVDAARAGGGRMEATNRSHERLAKLARRRPGESAGPAVSGHEMFACRVRERLIERGERGADLLGDLRAFAAELAGRVVVHHYDRAGEPVERAQGLQAREQAL